MPYGLTDSEFQFLTDTVIEPLKQVYAKVYLFGSRANGKYKKFSDIDILYIPESSQPISSSLISKIVTTLEDSQFAYKVDLVSSKELAASYRPSVDTDKIEL